MNNTPISSVILHVITTHFVMLSECRLKLCALKLFSGNFRMPQRDSCQATRYKSQTSSRRRFGRRMARWIPSFEYIWSLIIFGSLNTCFYHIIQVSISRALFNFLQCIQCLFTVSETVALLLCLPSAGLKAAEALASTNAKCLYFNKTSNSKRTFV